MPVSARTGRQGNLVHSRRLVTPGPARCWSAAARAAGSGPSRSTRTWPACSPTGPRPTDPRSRRWTDPEDGPASPAGQHRACRPGPRVARNRASKAGAHSPWYIAARHRPLTARIPLNVVPQWQGHTNPEVTLRIYLPIVDSTHTMAVMP